MNNNTKVKFNRAHDAYSRVKHGRGGSEDVALAKEVGHKPRHSKHAKVAWNGSIRQD